MRDKEKYNKIPVYYCNHCGSLNIRRDLTGEYCFDCGFTEISRAPIERWIEWYKEQHGKDPLE